MVGGLWGGVLGAVLGGEWAGYRGLGRFPDGSKLGDGFRPRGMAKTLMGIRVLGGFFRDFPFLSTWGRFSAVFGPKCCLAQNSGFLTVLGGKVDNFRGLGGFGGGLEGVSRGYLGGGLGGGIGGVWVGGIGGV